MYAHAPVLGRQEGVMGCLSKLNYWNEKSGKGKAGDEKTGFFWIFFGVCVHMKSQDREINQGVVGVL